MQTTLTPTQLLKLYTLVFPDTMRDSDIMIAEIHDILFRPTYRFTKQPFPNWKSDVMHYLQHVDYDASLLSMNVSFDKIDA
jgi:hypothetical protein